MPPALSRSGFRGLSPGLVITGLGVLLILHNFDLINVWSLRRYWPLLLVAFGLAKVLENAKDGRVFGMVLIAVGAALQARELDLLNLSLRQVIRFAPLLLVGLGIKLLIGYRREGNLTAGLLLVVLGGILQVDVLGWLPFPAWRLWPAVIIVIGVGMLQHAVSRPRGA